VNRYPRALEFADQPPLFGLQVVQRLEVVLAELLVLGAVVKDLPDDDDQGVSESEDGLVLPALCRADVLEATGIDWRPVWYALEELEGVEVLLGT